MRRALAGMAVGLALVAALGACSSDGGDSTLGEGLSDGTDTVKLHVATFLTALTEGEWKRACGKLTPEYREKLGGRRGCPRYWKSYSTPRVAFFGEEIATGQIDALDLAVSRQSADMATVTGPDGQQKVRLLKTPEEGWQIDSIEPLPAG